MTTSDAEQRRMAAIEAGAKALAAEGVHMPTGVSSIVVDALIAAGFGTDWPGRAVGPDAREGETQGRGDTKPSGGHAEPSDPPSPTSGSGGEPTITLRDAVQRLQPPEEAHEAWKHGFLVACQVVVQIIDTIDTNG